MALLAVILLLLTGCRTSRGADSGLAEQDLFRAPHPTFTPTAAVGGAAPYPPPAPAGGAQVQAPPPPANPASLEAPRAIVNAPLVNLRSGPGTDTNIIAMVERGAEYDIVGRSADDEWWQVCCADDQVAWIASDFVDTDGSVDAVPAGATDAVAAAPAASTTSTQAVPDLGGSGGAATFDLIAKEQFPETKLVRVYLYVYDGTNALAGYTLRILKDGREIPVSAQSFGGQPAFTWPFQDARQRYQNLKIEIPNEPAAGAWSVQLIDPQGNPVGPPAEFSLANNDAQQELYVRYERGQ